MKQKNSLKQCLALLLTLVMCLALAVPALAENSYLDDEGTQWYYDTQGSLRKMGTDGPAGEPAPGGNYLMSQNGAYYYEDIYGSVAANSIYAGSSRSSISSQPYLILTGGGSYSYGDTVALTVDTNVSSSDISWNYDSSYLSHRGNGRFEVIGADSDAKRELTITARCKNQGLAAYANITVNRGYPRVSVASLSQSSLTLPVRSSSALILNVLDSRSNYSVSWSSSDAAVATVSGDNSGATVSSQGKGGSCTVTARVADNSTGKSYTASCSVRVESDPGKTFSPVIAASIDGSATGITLYDSLCEQFHAVYGAEPGERTIVTLSEGANKAGVMALSDGSAVTNGSNYTLEQFRAMSLKPNAAGSYSTPYTLRDGSSILNGTLTVNVRPGTVDADIKLGAIGASTFHQTTASGGTGADILSAAIAQALDGTELNWSYLRFQKPYDGIGALYADSARAELSSSTNVNASALSSLYFVPIASGMFTAGVQVFNASGAILASGTVDIDIPAAKPRGTTTETLPVSIAAPKVVLTSQKLTVNGQPKNTEIYNIDGSNYFKLRDMAMLLKGTGSQFSVNYDAGRNTITVSTGAAYTAVGGELATGTDKSASAVRSAQSIEVNGAKVNLSAFNIGGNNFFKLRELGDQLGFDVDYDAATATMLVTSR